MRRVVVTVAIFLVTAAPAGAKTIGRGEMLALGVQSGKPYAVLARGNVDMPFMLVAGTKKTPFGIPGAEDPDIGPNSDGNLRIAFDRGVSSGLEFQAAPATAPNHARFAGRGTAAPQVDGANLAYPDEVGNAVDGPATLTTDAPLHRHVPLDAQQGIVLDLDQQRDATRLELLGANAPTAPAISVNRLQDIDASLAIGDDGTAYVALAVNGRVLLATAKLDTTARWTVKRIATHATGAPAIAHVNGKTHVAYERNKAIYVDSRRQGLGAHPLLADDGSRMFAGWTHDGAAELVRVR
jgi:hypothetical protein